MARRARVAAVGTLLALGAVCGTTLDGQEPGGSVDIRDGSGEPGEIVRVRLLATFDEPLQGFFLDLAYDAERLRYLGFDTRGSAAQGADPLSVVHGDLGGEGTCGILPGRGQSLGFRIPPGSGVHLGNLAFLVLPRAPTGDAAITPVRDAPATGSSSALILERDDETVAVVPAGFSPGTIDVLAPEGPRPVSDLSCDQHLDRIRLRFEPSGDYDEIQVSRDGFALADLPGDARSFEEPFSSTGILTYQVTALLDGEASIPAECSLLSLPPTAPPVLDLSCEGESLSWRNPVEYDALSVMRDGVEIADLPGAATRFDDPEPSAEMAIYTVEGRIGAFSSPGASCVSRGTWMVEVGDALAPLDASRIVIPMYVTTPETVEGFDFHLDIDTSRFRLVRDYDASLAGTVDQPLPEYFHMGIGGPHRAPTAGIIYDQLAPREAEKDLSPGLRQRVFNFIFEPLGEFDEGESFRVGLHQASFVRNRGALSRRPDVVVPGEIRLGPSVPPPVAALVASAGEDPRLSWESPADYDRIVIERNGSPAGETDGDERSWVDTGAPRGIHVYKVFGIVEGARSHPALAFVSTFIPEGAFIRGDANGDGKIDVADPVATLVFLFHTGTLACEDAADIDDDGIITITDAIAGLGFLFQSPGSLKAPGGLYPWFDPTPDSLDCGR